MTASWAERRDDGWRLAIRVQPGSGRSQVMGTHADELKVRVAAPANEGKANAELVRFLARQLGIPQRRVQLIRGDKTRSKVIGISGDVNLDLLTPSG